VALKIEQDWGRFREIVRGKVKQNLRKYIVHSELIGKKGKDLVSIPVPQVEIPHFVHSPEKSGGVGQGQGEVGTPIGIGEGGGDGHAGNQPGQHILEVELTLEELARILGEELELPNIEPRGKKNIKSFSGRYTGIHTAGPESLRHLRRTFREALKRQITSGSYDPINPVIIPITEDKRYKLRETFEEPAYNAVVIYMMDISGSMGSEQKEIVRVESFWIDTWLRYQYRDIETKYIVHDAVAREVDRDIFFRVRESGGTIISSAYKLCRKIIEERYPPDEWNIYAFHFSDGDNWSRDDTHECIEILEEDLLPKVNLFCYGQVESPYGSGQFFYDLEDHLKDKENLVLSKIANKDAVYDSIKQFLGRGG
jgi:sporulation protein YhbH